MSQEINNLTERFSKVVPDPCGESAERQNWLEVRNQLRALNEGNQIFNNNGEFTTDIANIDNLNVVIIDAHTTNTTNLYVTNIFIGGGGGTTTFPLNIFIHFTLSGSLAGGSSGATVTKYSGPASLNPGGSTTVYDEQGLFPRARSGAKGTAIYNFHDKTWDVIACDQLAWYLKGTLSGALSGGSTASVGSCAALSPFPFSQTPGASVTASNPLKLMGVTGYKVRLMYNRPDDVYEVVNVEHFITTPQIDTRWDETDGKLYESKLSGAVLTDNETPTETLVDESVSCPVT